MLFLGVLAPLLLAIAALLLVSIGGVAVLSAVRAYVSGESLWSKARATAVAQLQAHARSGNASDYRRFQDALTVAQGDRAARLEMDKARPDMSIVQAGLLAGENARADIPGMIRLYRYCRRFEFMEEAVSAWIEGDRLVEQVETIGQRIHSQVERGDPPAAFDRLLGDLDVLNGRLITAERYFSATLGRASRRLEGGLAMLVTGMSVLLAAGGALLVKRSLRQQLDDQRLHVEANQRWDIAADAAEIGLFEWNLAEDRFELDERAARLYHLRGADAGTVLRRSELRALTHPDDQPFLRAGLEEAARTGELFRRRYRVVLAEGEVRHFEVIGRVRDPLAPEQSRMIGIVRDVSVEVAQSQMLRDKEAAERGASLRVEFLSHLSQELRTPLNAVLGVAQLLQLDTREPLTANQACRVRMLQDSGAHLLRLVEDVLDVTRIDSGQMSLNIVSTDVLAIVRESLNVVEPERASFAVRIEDRLPHKSVLVRADAQRLQQVFVNLISNACRYSTRGGVVTLGLRESDRRVEVDVMNEGPGMSPEELVALFQPSRRSVPGVEARGVGLGLVLVKLLLERMRADVMVSSEPGRGSCFTVTLPTV